LQRREQIQFLIGTCLTLAQEESEKADSVDMLSDALAEGVTVTITEQGEQVISHRDPFEIPEVGSEFNVQFLQCF